jgi:large subunit ribosomal protein L4
MKVTVFDNKGIKKEDKKLNDKVFGEDLNQPLLSEVITLYRSNLRQGTAKTKNMGEVAGGGRKPWKQKGTGRARTGTNRNPLWRGGGIIFGPTGDQNWYKTIPSQKRLRALVNALSLKAKEGKINILETLDIKDPKTKTLASVLNKIEAKGKILIVTPEVNEVIVKSGRNIANLNIKAASQINALDVILADSIILLAGAEAKLEGLVK